MSNLSLNGSLRTCKVEQGSADRIQSDRFENPDLMVCPVWSGFDLANRPVCYDSFYTKSAGCNSPMDRVDVENALRPQYMEYINLDAEGFKHNNNMIMEGYTAGACNNPNTNMNCYGSGVQTINVQRNLPKVTGNFGTVPSNANIQSQCGNYPETLAMHQENNRKLQALQHASQNQNTRRWSGM